MASSSSRTLSTDETTADETRPDERRPDLLLSGDDMMSTMDWFSTLMTVLDSPDKASQELEELLLQDPIDEDVGLFQRRSGPQVWLVTCLSWQIPQTCVDILSSPSQAGSRFMTPRYAYVLCRQSLAHDPVPEIPSANLGTIDSVMTNK